MQREYSLFVVLVGTVIRYVRCLLLHNHVLVLVAESLRSLGTETGNRGPVTLL